jgi:hypothetical protein
VKIQKGEKETKMARRVKAYKNGIYPLDSTQIL